MNYLFQYYAIQVFAFILDLLPLPVSSGFARIVGRLFYWIAISRRKVALANLKRAYGDSLSTDEKKRLVKKAFENTALSILELFLIRKIKKNTHHHFTIQGKEILETALSEGQGVILITSHLGSWEYLGFLFYLLKIPCSVIVKTLKSDLLDKKINDLRRETGIAPIPKKNAIRGALTELQENHVVAILIDQWAGREGIWIDFFGAPTSTTSLPARLAKKTGCLLVPAYCLRKGTGKYEILVLPPVPLPEDESDWETNVTRSLNEMLEKHIRQYPDQWSWGHRRWKIKPDTWRQP